jgi:hypothetical protein
MSFNVRGLAFKQSVWILIGVTVVFFTIFYVAGMQLHGCLSKLVIQKGE